MASIKATARGYRAQVEILGVRASKSFRTRREALVWAAIREDEIRTLASTAPASRVTVGEALARYAAEVSPTKGGRRWELTRLAALVREPEFSPTKKLATLTPVDLAAWRDRRGKLVSAGTVIREMGLVSAVLETARRDWGWLAANPMRDVRKPREPDHREVIISASQIRAMLRVMHYRRGPCRSVTQAVAVAFLLALRTGMRAGEICELPWSRVHADYATVRGKTGQRDVPLTYPARRLIESMRGFDPQLVFGLNSDSMSSLFRKYRQRAGLEGFTFHDTRHTAATRLSRRVDAITLCKIFGWKNATMALTYVNPTASDIAKLLAKR